MVVSVLFAHVSCVYDKNGGGVPMELRTEEIQHQDLDGRALRVFLKALEIAGGPRALVQRRHLTWVPSLLEAAYVIVLKEEYGKTEDQIASTLGITRNTLRLILRADPETVRRRLQEPAEETEEAKAHVAGGLAKLAYAALKGGEKIELLETLSQAS